MTKFCTQCRKYFSVPDDEEFMHGCPRCGTEQENEDEKLIEKFMYEDGMSRFEAEERLADLKWEKQNQQD